VNNLPKAESNSRPLSRSSQVQFARTITLSGGSHISLKSVQKRRLKKRLQDQFSQARRQAQFAQSIHGVVRTISQEQNATRSTSKRLGDRPYVNSSSAHYSSSMRRLSNVDITFICTRSAVNVFLRRYRMYVSRETSMCSTQSTVFGCYAVSPVCIRPRVIMPSLCERRFGRSESILFFREVKKVK